mgnify:CR=1 FL=1
MRAQDSREASKLGTILHQIRGLPLEKDSTYRYYVVDRGYTMRPVHPQDAVSVGTEVRFYPPSRDPAILKSITSDNAAN